MCDPRTNGELFFYSKIINKINVIFDVGCSNSDFIDIEKEVHYFDPNPLFIEELKTKKNRNINSYLIHLDYTIKQQRCIIIQDINLYLIEY